MIQALDLLGINGWSITPKHTVLFKVTKLFSFAFHFVSHKITDELPCLLYTTGNLTLCTKSLIREVYLTVCTCLLRQGISVINIRSPSSTWCTSTDMITLTRPRLT